MQSFFPKQFPLITTVALSRALKLVLFLVVVFCAHFSHAQVPTILYPSSPLLVCQDTVIRLIGAAPPTGSTYVWSVDPLSEGQIIGPANKDTVYVRLTKAQNDTKIYYTDPVTDLSRIARIHFHAPSAAKAGSDASICGTSSYKLAAIAPTRGSGSWHVINAPDNLSYFPDNTDPKALVGNLNKGVNQLVWEVGTTQCPTKKLMDTLVILNLTPSSPYAGEDTSVCASSVSLKAEMPTFGMGKWEVPVGVMVDDVSNHHTNATNLLPGDNVFIWSTFINATSSCALYDTLVVKAFQPQTAMIFGKTFSDTVLCTNQLLLNATSGPGSWSIKKGSGSFGPTINGSTLVSSLGPGIDSLVWTLQNTGCSSSSASLRIINNSVTKPVATKDSCFISPFSSLLTLKVKNVLKLGETGSWDIKRAPSSFGILNLSNQPLTHTATFNTQGAGRYYFIYRNNNGGCKDSVISNYYLVTKAVLPPDTCIYTTANQSIAFTLKAKSIPIGTEKAKWTLPTLPSSTTANGTTVSFTAPPGVYRFVYEIWDTLCAVTKDTITVTVANKAKISPFPTCFLSNSQALSATTLMTGENGKWSSPDVMSFSSATNTLTTASSIKIGRQSVIWEVTHANGCKSRDTAKFTRLTTPEIKEPLNYKCFPFDPSTSLRDSISGNTPAPNESGYWVTIPSPTLTYPLVPKDSTKLYIVKQNAPGVYKVAWKINTLECPSLAAASDTISLYFVTKPVSIKDTFFVTPLSTKPVVLAKTSPLVGESGRWIAGADTVKSQSFTVQDTTVGTYNYRYQIYNGPCLSSSNNKVILITNPAIIPQNCLKGNISNITLSARKGISTAAGESSSWTVDTSKYKVSFAPEPNNPNRLAINFYDAVSQKIINGRFIVTHTVKSGPFSVSASLTLTNLTKPVAWLDTCVRDTFVALKSPQLFPQLQSYESAYWIKKAASPETSVFRNGNQINNVLANLKPGQMSLALVISNDSATCRDTSSFSALTVVTKAKAFSVLTSCIKDTVATITAISKPVAGERGKWEYFKSYLPRNAGFKFENDTLPTTTLEGLTYRNTKLKWTITNKNNPSCFSFDTTNTQLVVTTRPITSFIDTCIIGSQNVVLRGNLAKPFESSVWIHNNQIIAKNKSLHPYSALSVGNNKILYSIYDSVFTCTQSDTLVVRVINQAKITSAPTCLVLKKDSTIKEKLTTRNDLAKGGATYSWQGIPVPVKENDSTYTTTILSSGVYKYKWQVSLTPSCFSTDSVMVTVVPKATAKIFSSCLVSPIAKDSLIANRVSGEGEKGTWITLGDALINKPDSASTSALLLSKGKKGFAWEVKNGSCQNKDTVYAIQISKAHVGSDTCLYYTPILNVKVNNAPLTVDESYQWSFLGSASVLTFDSLSPTSTDVRGFAKGLNQIKFKVKSLLGQCQDSVILNYTTLTTSDLEDTSYVCSKQTALSAKSIDSQFGESNAWSMQPTSSIVRQTQDSVYLRNLSNDIIYTLYLTTKGPSNCSLKDSIKIINRQLDTVFIRSENLLDNNNTFYTCDQSIRLYVSDYLKDIMGSIGAWSPPIEPAGNRGLEVVTSTVTPQPNTLAFDIKSMIQPGIYTFIWTQKNKTCPLLTDTIRVEKRDGLVGLQSNFVDSICGTEYTFPATAPFIVKDAEEVSWVPQLFSVGVENPKSKDPSIVKLTTLGAYNNIIHYNVKKGGCSGTVNINILRYEPVYELNVKGSKSRSYCDAIGDSLKATHTLPGPVKEYFKIYWTNVKEGQNFNNLTSLSGPVDMNQIALVKDIPYDLPKTYYIVAKNGSCPRKYDSVTVYNYSKPTGVEISARKEWCGTSPYVIGKKDQKFAVGKWSTDAPNSSFRIFSDTTAILTIPSAKGSYSIKWLVANGSCKDSSTTQITLGDSVSKAEILTNDTVVCNAPTLLLKAKTPVLGKGVWLGKSGEILFDSSRFVYNVVREGQENNFFVWRVYSSESPFCYSLDTVYHKYYQAPDQAIAGVTQNLVKNSTFLAGNKEEFGTGTWTIKKGTGTIADIHSHNSEVTNLGFGENIFTWTISNGSCTPSSDFVVISFNDFDIPQGFSPNGDTRNDRFEIKGLESYKGTELKVFNRWGSEVYVSNDYRNDWGAEGLADDTYYYVMTLVTGKRYHGYLVVKRN